ncbi:hypothetical protein ACHWQZ_G000307 [Mnemiopsis leidyi]
MGRLREKIEEAGITPAKVGACLVVHEIIGISVLFGSWAVCYKLLKHNSAQRILQTLAQHRTYSAGKTWVERRFSRITQRLPSLDSERFIIAGAMSTVMRKMSAPVLVPGKIVLSLWLVRLWSS